MNLKDFIKLITNTTLEKAKTFRGDWTVNDPTSPHYIKNRPFYTIDEKIELCNGTIEFTDSEGLYLGILAEPSSYEIKSDTVAKLILDNIEYNLEARMLPLEITEGNEIYYFGNGGLVGGNDTGESFFIMIDGGSGSVAMLIASNAETHEVIFTSNILTTIKIDEKYLPKMVGKDTSGVEYNIDGNTYIPEDSEVFNDYKNNIAAGYYSHAEGGSTTAVGNWSHVEGRLTIASGASSHAEGLETVALGNCSHAEGQDTKASGYSSHAEGVYTEASGNSSHAEGQNTEASGYSSHAEGQKTKASGYSSHAEGSDTIAAGHSQHVQGKNNIEDTENKYAHIVGNGNSINARSNAHTLDWDGNAWFAGNVYVGANNKELATKEYVDSRGGSSGGVTSWDDLEDKPFGLIDNDNENYILPSTQMALASQDEAMTMYILGNSIEGVALGVDYVVNYNGNNYICTAQSIEVEGGLIVTGLGNTAALGGEDTGEPFALAVLPPEAISTLGFGVALYSLDMAPSVTISISSNKAIKKLDNKFLNLDWLPTRNKTVEILYDQETYFNNSGQNIHAGKAYFEIVPGEEYTINWNGTTYNCISQLVPVEGTFVPAIGNASLISSNTPNTGESFAILILLNNTIMYSTALNEYVSLSITGPKYTYNTMPSQYMPKETNTLALKQLTFIDPDFETASFHMTAGGQLIWGGTSIIANGKTLATEAYVDTYATRISTLETKIGDGFEEITSEEIQALFAS